MAKFVVTMSDGTVRHFAADSFEWHANGFVTLCRFDGCRCDEELAVFYQPREVVNATAMEVAVREEEGK